jgi:hypothetical protein
MPNVATVGLSTLCDGPPVAVRTLPESGREVRVIGRAHGNRERKPSGHKFGIGAEGTTSISPLMSLPRKTGAEISLVQGSSKALEKLGE